jgi:hypothetical protein
VKVGWAPASQQKGYLVNLTLLAYAGKEYFIIFLDWKDINGHLGKAGTLVAALGTLLVALLGDWVGLSCNCLRNVFLGQFLRYTSPHLPLIK